ncbi:hypothetical protein MMC16_006246 [Acarospora aff. strigata]|nr:hypothetical protein [Acarospora aff. strigata]
MPISPRLVNIPLRIGELAFAATVAGLIGRYLHRVHNTRAWDHKRFIYTEVVAGLAMLLALLWLIPFNANIVHHVVDLLMFVLWMIAFGLLVNFIGPLKCGSVFSWGDITEKGTCQRWKAAVAFTFLSAMFWLASALLGMWMARRARRNVVATDGTHGAATGAPRRKWYSNAKV